MSNHTHASTAADTTNDAPLPTLDRLLTVLPEAVDTAMRKALPDKYTPELARQIADRTAANLRENTAANTASMPVEGPRTITYPLRTGGSLTTPCPAWCTDDHTYDVAHGIDPEDLLHQGDKTGLDYNADGIEVSILVARIAQWPYNPDDARPYIEYTPEGSTGASLYLTDPLQVGEEISKVRGHLRALEELAGQLAEAQAAHHAAHATGIDGSWVSLTRTDLMSMPVAYLLKVFGVKVVESDEPMDNTNLVLGGQPGDMLMLVNPETPQHIREDATRTALLHWDESRRGGAA